MVVRFLDCIGSHYMVGIQQGRMGKQAIHAAWEIFSDSQHLEMIRKAKFAPKALYLVHCQQKADNFLKKIVKDTLPEQHERIKGMASGADMPEKMIYVLQAIEMELIPKPSMYALGSGTLMGIKPNATTTGEPVLIKNFDYTLPYQDMLLVRRNKPLAGCQTLDISLAFSSGAHAGINEHGLCFLHTFAYPSDSLGFKNIPISIVLQEALETCYTAEEAARLINKHARDAGANILLADASGDMRVLETSRSSSAQRFAENNYIIAANHYISPEMTKHQFPIDSKWGDKALPRLKEEGVYESSISRYARADQLLSKGEINPDSVEQILADHNEGVPGDNTICRHGAVFSTQASIILYPTRKSIRVSSGKPCEGRFEEFTMKKL
ncbi:C45 family autoproteolytic acyltransferase/hydolase [Phosphitispora sp. TUW77]|uniref:C45 family autoproteolytic acyltransferase/hydolase n=1 Tax=Phosphitispora sp. TUW77 TaxID=3152361 RepID=UPI003AB37D6F